ncbi:MAG: sulfite exporter TauE/SafE family protein [Polyangiales bacterium]
MEILGVCFALLIGVSLGLLGGGGSILTVPILLYVFTLPPRTAIATSLLVVGTTSAAALIPHARAARVRWRVGALFGATSMVGAYLAGRVGAHIPGAVQILAFGVMMLVTAAAMMRGRKVPAGAAEGAGLPLGTMVAQGLGVGAVTGLVGAGGGFLVVPALVLMGGLPMPVAVGTSLMVIAMNSFAGFAGYLSSVAIPWSIAAMVVTAAVLGSALGARLVRHVSPDRLRKGFAWFVVVMAVFILGQEVPRLFGVRVSVATHWPWLLAAMSVPPAVGGLLALRRAHAPA